jgi:hypothetical protein
LVSIRIGWRAERTQEVLLEILYEEVTHIPSET